MKLDEGIVDQRIGLDITPLIDVVFLLVLFFAVSTSFISTEDLESLQSTLVSLTVDKQQLGGRLRYQDTELQRLGTTLRGLQSDYDLMVARKTAELEALAREVERAEGEQAKMRWMAAALEEQRVSLETALDDTRGTNESLRSQLEQAFRDYQALDLRLDASRAEVDRKARTEALLLALLEERTKGEASLQARLETSESTRRQLEAATASLEERSERIEVERIRLAALLATAGERVDASDAELELLRTRVARLSATVEEHRRVARRGEEQVRQANEVQASLSETLGAYLADRRLGITRERQKLTLQLSDQVLFDSGSAHITSDGLTVLRSVGEALEGKLGHLAVQIGGHTDNVPLSVRGGDGRLVTNWELSATRAVNVVRFLESEVGLDPGRLSAVGYGEHRPMAANDDATGRARNRRIEIVLVPR